MTSSGWLRRTGLWSGTLVLAASLVTVFVADLPAVAALVFGAGLLFLTILALAWAARGLTGEGSRTDASGPSPRPLLVLVFPAKLLLNLVLVYIAIVQLQLNAAFFLLGVGIVALALVLAHLRHRGAA